MKDKNLVGVLVLLLVTSFFSTARSQTVSGDNLRYIEVSGSSEIEIEPDEIRFIVGIQEYWLEEFEKRKDYKDYKTKVKIEDIEKDLVAKLKLTGVSKEQIVVKEVGNYWRNLGKEFLIGKEIELQLTDFGKIDEIVDVLDMKGISYMRIGELKNKHIAELRKEVKIAALKAAKEKASYLLESLGEHLGNILSITEIENNNWQPQSVLQPLVSNTVISSSDHSDSENNRKIKLRYEIKARFAIGANAF